MDTISTSHPALTPDVVAALRAPFAWDVIEVRPGAAGALRAKDSTGALALAYADPRVYMERLDTVVGPEHWSVEFTPWGDHRLICRLTIFGIMKSSTGEAGGALWAKDKNAGTVAEAQAFKRSCVAFGLGRFLYDLPQIWARGSGDSKSFTFENPARVIEEMRRKYELAHAKPTSLPPRSPDLPTPPVTDPTTSAPAAVRHARSALVRLAHASPAQKQATARAALSDAEQRTGVQHPR